ncbi:MAG: hypothetical protein A2139_05760 [Desulfobacca sp. RBG_16_60_12]|nr:MAG: hypothetical protein A2139_05760 [Desulfobacca sp. RBG_16_60_12]
MVPVSLFFFQVMAPVGGLTRPMARSAAIPGVNMGRLAVTTVGWFRAELMNPWRGEPTTEAG